MEGNSTILQNNISSFAIAKAEIISFLPILSEKPRLFRAGM